MAGETEEASVQVHEDVAMKIGQRMVEGGRLSGLSPQVTGELKRHIAQTVASSWGVRTPRFVANGGGWLVDLSDVSGEVLYGVVRSDGGVRVMDDVIDEDLAMNLLGRDAPMDPGNEGGVKEDAMRSSSPRPVFQPPPKPQPDEPRLVVWWESTTKNDVIMDDEVQVENTTYAEVQAKVLPLLMRGCRVEVWSGRKQPKISVDL